MALPSQTTTFPMTENKKNKGSRASELREAAMSIARYVGEKKATVYASSADYFLFMSLVPIMMLLVSLVRFLPFSETEVLQAFSGTVPPSVFSVVSAIISGIYRGGSAATVISIVLTLFSASAAMRPVMKGLDSVYGAERDDRLPLFFAKAAVYMLVLVLIVLASLVLLVYGEQVLWLLHSFLPQTRIGDSIIAHSDYLRYLLVITLLFASFLLLYSKVPAGKHAVKVQIPGAAFCTAAWVIFSWIFQLYIALSDMFGAYGYIGTIMVAMMWMYYCLLFLLVGGCINAYFEKR